MGFMCSSVYAQLLRQEYGLFIMDDKPCGS